MSLQSEFEKIRSLTQKLAGMPVQDIAVAQDIVSRIVSFAKKYPQATTQIAQIKSKCLWVLKLAQQRKSQTAAEIMAMEGATPVPPTIRSEFRDIEKLQLYNIEEEMYDETKELTSFHLIMTFRQLHMHTQRANWITLKAYEHFVTILGHAIEVRIRKNILANIQASFKRGGRLQDDIIPGSRRWPSLSKRYVDSYPQKKGRRHFGILTGGMKRNLWREGIVKIHFKGGKRGQGAKTVTADFATSKAGRKLARFHFGRESGRGKQPPRPVTFLRQKDLRAITGLIRVTFNNLTKSLYSIYAGIRIGSMPAPRTGAEFRMFKVWSASGSRVPEGTT